MGMQTFIVLFSLHVSNCEIYTKNKMLNEKSSFLVNSSEFEDFLAQSKLKEK